MIKIAISGQLGSGKNTLAEMIVRNYINPGMRYKIVALADPIKNMIMQMIPNADKQCLWGESELRSKVIPGNMKDLTGQPLTYRQALIDIGSLGRRYSPDIWLNALIQDANDKSIAVYIVADVRFINEFNYLKNNEFYMVRIKRNKTSEINDISETAQLEIPDSLFNYVLENNNSLDELNYHAKTLINKLA